MRTPTLTDLAGLDGRRFIVVGAGLGIGRSIARLLAAHGCSLGLVDLDEARLDELSSELAELGCPTTQIALDVTVTGAPATAMAAVVERLGGVDGLVNIVGRGSAGALIDSDVDRQQRAMHVNYLHHVGFGIEFARHCVAQGHPGSVTMVASMSGIVPFPDQSFYGAAKAALISMTKSMAVEWGPHGIRVNAVAPGNVRTDRNQRGPEEERRLSEGIPLGRISEQTEIAAAVVFLASDLASYVNGQTLVVDGGASLVTRSWPAFAPR